MNKVELVLPPLYDIQKEFIYDDHPISICVAGTKTGKTVGCSEWMVDGAWNDTEPTINWWVAPVFKQVSIGYNRMKQLIPPEYAEFKDSYHTIILKHNGARIEGRSGDNPDNLYGEGVHRMVGDEADRMKEQSWQAMLSTITQTKGPVKLISNPVRKGSWFHMLWTRGFIGKDPTVKSFRIKTSDNPYIDAGMIERAKQMLPIDVFRSLYEGEWPEGEGSVFRKFRQCMRGKLEDYDPTLSYVLGSDLAKAQDFTVIFVMCRETRHVVYYERFNKIDWTFIKQRLMDASKQYGNCEMYLDASGVGDPVCDDIEAFGFSVERVKTQSDKRDLIDLLRVALEQGMISFPSTLKQLINEIELFGYRISSHGTVQYSAPEGFNDDCVIALALTVKGLEGHLYNGLNLTHEQQPDKQFWKDEIMAGPSCYGEDW